MKHSPLLLAVSLSVLATNALAGDMGPTKPDWTWVSTISAGLAWESGGENQTFFLTPEIEKSYIADKSTKTLADGEFFIGLQKSFSQQIQGQLGLALASVTNATLSGIIWDDADPQFDNLAYSYKVQHSHVALKGKVLFDNNYWVIPWLSASIGVGFNHAHDFINTPLIFEAIPNNNFANHTETALTYTVGAGVQKALNANWQIGLGYEFADWGKSELGRAIGQTINSGLSADHLYTNGVLFNLTYIA